MILEKILGTIWEKLTISSFSGRQWAYPREFINQLAHHNGYHIEWKNVSQRQMIEASIEAEKGNVKPLAALIHANLTDRDIALFIKQNRSFDGGHAKLFSAGAGKKYLEMLKLYPAILDTLFSFKIIFNLIKQK